LQGANICSILLARGSAAHCARLDERFAPNRWYLVVSLGDLQRPDLARRGLPTLPLDVAAVRTFDTPEFAGMTFLEVEAKSALNKVKGMMFPWSINPYRGCSHACRYCAAGETPILMADGRTKEIADLRVGDDVYGTIQAGAYRRYVVTKVLDHWKTVRRAYRVTLADGTTLVASGDHRFLSNHGWKHVTGAEQGPLQRPHLTTNNRLVGTGAFEEGPKQTEAYRRGYLCGMIRGDGHIDHPSDSVRRYDRFLADLGGVETSNTLGLVLSHPDDDWAKGFLAGIFDAEGSCSGGILKIATTDQVILDAMSAALDRFKIPHQVEPPRPNGCRAVRVTGGLRQHLRFFHLTDPAIRRKCNIEQRAVKGPADLHVKAIEDLGVFMPMYDITTGTGDFIANGVISHNCFARPTHTSLNLNPLGDFEKTVVVKTNVVDVLKRELAKPSWKGEHVAMGTNTDPYQRCEGRYALMPGIITALADSLTPFSILTKGTLIQRDLPALTAAAQKVPVSAAMSIGTIDEEVWRSSEPGTPSPAARLACVKALNDAGIPTGVMLAPILPGLSDRPDQLTELITSAVQAGATHVTPIVLHLRSGVRELIMPWLEAEHPHLVGRYQTLYHSSEAAQEYRDGVMTFISEQREAAWRRHGRPKPQPGAGTRGRRRPGGPAHQPRDDGGEQLTLTL
jgi:DNA repair photolyase